MKSIQSIIFLLSTLLVTHSLFANELSYSKQELNAFSEQEERALTQPLDQDMQQQIKIKQNESQALSKSAITVDQDWRQRLKPAHLKGVIDIPNGKPNPQATPSGVMVFVSLTMPESTLRSLLKQSEQGQVPLVIRGVLPGGFVATTKKIQSLIQTPNNQPIGSGFAISPEWFHTFNIIEVPTFVSVKPGKCLPKQACDVTDYDIVRGNVSLHDALTYLRKGDTKDVVEAAIKRLTP